MGRRMKKVENHWFNNDNYNDILLRTHGPYHRHKNTKTG